MKLYWLLAALLLTACADTDNYAPVTDISETDAIPRTGIHIVHHGETMYEIAWRYGLDYRKVAELNQMESPYMLHTGQAIRLQAGHASVAIVPSITPANHSEAVVTRQEAPSTFSQEANSGSAWIWPAKGRILQSFSGSHKGINIAGQPDAPVYAAAAGQVVYSGDGLRAYGNLLIIKHDNVYLSAYAHNAVLLVKEGQWVKKGQKIAEMGDTGTDKTMLHFEIRQAGKPVDPMSLLPAAS